MAPRVWFLNLDAERELQAPKGYQPSLHRIALLHKHARPALNLLGTGDVALLASGLSFDRNGQPCELPKGVVGRCWCPTPYARGALTARAVSPEPAPPLSVLVAANQRGFTVDLVPGLPQREFVTNLPQAMDKLHRPLERGWLLKRALSYAAAGQRRIAGQPNADDARWIAQALRRGGLLIEPYVDIQAEFCIHGRLDRAGHLTVGRACRQWVGPRGAFIRATPLEPRELSPPELGLLERSVEVVAERLLALGYFGPFGIDAHRYRTDHGTNGFEPLSEVNARYTLGYAVGMTT